MSENAARRFYQGEGQTLDCAVDPSLITYYVVQPFKVDGYSAESIHKFQQLFTTFENNSLRGIDRPMVETGCKLIAIIPCSDIFGVDLLLDKHQDLISERMKVMK